MKTIRLLLIISMLYGCASAWVVSQRSDGGVIGYRNPAFTSKETITETIKEKIPCSDFIVISDDLKSRQHIYMTQKSITTSGGDTAHVPVANTGTSYWRELTYSCNVK